MAGGYLEFAIDPNVHDGGGDPCGDRRRGCRPSRGAHIVEAVPDNHVFVGNRPQPVLQPPIRRLFVPTTPTISPCDKIRERRVCRDHTP